MEPTLPDPILEAQATLKASVEKRVKDALTELEAIQVKYRVLFIPVCTIRVMGNNPAFESGIQVVPQ